MGTAVVTGASSGIGAATARALAKEGRYDVVLAARRSERLTALADEIGARPIPTDITDATAVTSLAEALDECEVLVNNAGAAIGAEPIASTEVAEWEASLNLNVLGTLRVTQALLPLVERARGTIVFVTSTAAYGNYATAGSYCAAKHAERCITETLRLELNGKPVRVCEIAPGMVHTPEFSLNRFQGDRDRAQTVYHDVDRPLVAEDVAQCIQFVLSLPEHVNVDSLTVRPVAQAGQHALFRGPIFHR